MGIDTINPAYDTVANGDGQTTTACEAGVNVDGPQDLPRSAAHLFYTRLNPILDNTQGHPFDSATLRSGQAAEHKVKRK